MKSIIKAILCVVVIFTAAPAQSYDAREPLVIIRFNNPDVNYQNSLSRAVVEAVRVKHDVIFDVVAGNGMEGESNRIMADMVKLGVPATSISFRTSGYNSNEVMIFVR